jgi:isoleucyl-tRNA synthetase
LGIGRGFAAGILEKVSAAMFDKVGDAEFIRGEHEILRFWAEQNIFDRLRRQNAGKPPWSFLDGPITANNPMGVHHAWGRTYKDTFQRYWAMNGRELRYQNGFDCQGLWVEVEVEKQLGFGAKAEIEQFGVDRFVWECKKRVLKYAAVQTEQSIRLGYWMDWDDPATLRRLADAVGTSQPITITTPRGEVVTDLAERIVERLGNPDWGGSYFTFSTENNETIWTFLKKCHQRGKIYRGHDVMPWSGKAGSAYSQMEVADGRKLTVHRALFVRFPVWSKDGTVPPPPSAPPTADDFRSPLNEYLLVWTTTPWTLTSNVAAMVNPELDYVRLQTKRDGAIYYFAQDNLEYQRLGKEFKEGFGRPEWTWPKDCPKLKTLAQIFRELGGYEVLGSLKGAELIGWRYRGPFDELPAQHAPGGFPASAASDASPGLTGAACHRVIDGGRDFKGNPHVVAGEGTGIVHSAPGCGDVDFQVGQQAGLVSIAPLGEDGRFLEGFGKFTGRVATAAETVDLILDDLRQKGLLIAVEKYPHIYPFCWRTGDELVFRLVDEWFIKMDWRDEIMNVTRQIRWLPDSIQGQERELEWLTNMRDWMISKKRYWGLALPIWVDEQTGDFEVIGSLAELKQRAVEGWSQFEGHTPHKPWIDRVKIRNPKTGGLMVRIPDVGNPWLDAGIVSFSTLGYNTHPAYWRKWFPADFVTECFPGQFRNWFYSLLAMATMMEGRPPFKTLLGHRLVMDEQGRPMHKSDGTAIWFEEAAEQLGVDTLRWMYLQQNPAQDLRFGTRHPERKVTLQTPDGPKSVTIDGAETCLVTSGPADDVRRLVLLPLWNSYAFFVNYARREGFDPTRAAVPIAERPEIDRWILSNLHVLIQRMRQALEAFDSPAACGAAASFIDDLSNWYIRRNRRRFSRGRELPGEPRSESDQQAAFQTLHQVLLTLTKLLAPLIPFVTERMYRNLSGVQSGRPFPADAPVSVHLCAYPVAEEHLIDSELNERMSLAQLVVKLGHKLRDDAGQRVRQPLPELRVACADPRQLQAIARLSDLIAEELNVKRVTPCTQLDGIVKYVYRANLKTLGPKYGQLLNVIKTQLPLLEPAQLEPLRRGEAVTVTLDGTTISLEPDDVQVVTEQAAEWHAADERGVQVALSSHLTPELVREGMARDFVRQVQQLRKDAELELEQRIRIRYSTAEAEAAAAIAEWSETICRETSAEELLHVAGGEEAGKPVTVGESRVFLRIERVPDEP